MFFSSRTVFALPSYILTIQGKPPTRYNLQHSAEYIFVVYLESDKQFGKRTQVIILCKFDQGSSTWCKLPFKIFIFIVPA